MIFKNPIRIHCQDEDKAPASFLMEDCATMIHLAEVPEEFYMDKEELIWFIRILNIRLERMN